MRILERVRDLQNLSLNKVGSYNIAYTYDETGRITKETVTGDVNRVIYYEYDIEDNIIRETYEDDSNKIVKDYVYDLGGNITEIKVTNPPKVIV